MGDAWVVNQPQVAQIPATGSWQLVKPNVARWRTHIEQAVTFCQLGSVTGGYDAALLMAAIVTQESGGEPQAVGGAWDTGLAQVVPRENPNLVFVNRPTQRELFDPQFNLNFAACLLRDNIQRTGNVWEGIHDYNGRGIHGGRKYADIILSHYNSFISVNSTSVISHFPMRGGRLTRAYGVPVTYQRSGYHTGLDLGIGIDDNLYAVGDGIIRHVGPLYCNALGKCRGPYSIVLELAPRFYATYSHNKQSFVAVGQRVKGGQLIAKVGSLGYSSGPHLHFELVQGQWTGDWKVPFSPENFIDPLPYFEGGFK